MPVNTCCKYGEYGSFEHLLVLVMTDLCSSSQWHVSVETCITVYYTKQTTAKKSYRFCKYGLFEHFLFLFRNDLNVCSSNIITSHTIIYFKV